MANPHPITVQLPQEPFHPKNALKGAVTGSMVGGAAGIFASAMQNSLAKTNVGAWGVVTRTGSTVATMSTSGLNPCQATAGANDPRSCCPRRLHVR